MNISIDTKAIRTQLEFELTEQFKRELTDRVMQHCTGSYDIGYRVKQTLDKYLTEQLPIIVEQHLRSTDIQSKIDKAVERRCLDEVNKFFKNKLQ